MNKTETREVLQDIVIFIESKDIYMDYIPLNKRMIIFQEYINGSTYQKIAEDLNVTKQNIWDIVQMAILQHNKRKKWN